MNREELKQAGLRAIGPCLKAKGYIAVVDVLIQMGGLSPKDYEQWRLGKIPCLENVIQLNVKKLVEVLRAIRANSLKGGLKPSWTAYVKWGKGPRQRLRFTKSGNPWLEELYATHYVTVKWAGSKSAEPPASQCEQTHPISVPTSLDFEMA